MTDEREQPEDERDEDEHPLESPEALREPRDVDDEEDRALQPGVTTATPDGR
ncbi:MAG TPA: hypothetical protein VFT35_08605 [Gaiellaceae bacterium]|jgi:hypothetical protein|nr:hypothetical protein [Gaiellaceae bacterium]